MYGRGTWAAIDILYFMPDAPMTFMNEADGMVLNITTETIFQHRQSRATNEGPGLGGGMKRSNSRILMALAGGEDDDDDEERDPSPKRDGVPKVNSRFTLSS